MPKRISIHGDRQWWIPEWRLWDLILVGLAKLVPSLQLSVSPVLDPSGGQAPGVGPGIHSAIVGGASSPPPPRTAGLGPAVTGDSMAIHDLLVGLRSLVQRFDVGALASSTSVSRLGSGCGSYSDPGCSDSGACAWSGVSGGSVTRGYSGSGPGRVSLPRRTLRRKLVNVRTQFTWPIRPNAKCMSGLRVPWERT